MTKTQLVGLLEAARAKIATPAQWTQESYAKDAEGAVASSYGTSAVCYCSVGAAKAAAGYNESHFPLTDALRNALKSSFDWYDGIVSYNDKPGRTHAEVLAVWDKAIEIAKAEAVVENLKRAKAKIAKPEAWTQGFFARDADGNDLRGNEEGAVCFCAYGAMEAATGNFYRGYHTCETEYIYLRRAVAAITGSNAESPPFYNDYEGRTHAEVLAMFDKAISLARAAVPVK